MIWTAVHCIDHVVGVGVVRLDSFVSEALRLALRRAMVSYGDMPTRCDGDGRDTMKLVDADVVGNGRGDDARTQFVIWFRRT